MPKSLFLFFLIFIGFISFTSAQNLSMEGIVQDSLGTPILGVNMLAKPLEEGNRTAFAFTDFNGRYKLNLPKDVSYSLSVTYIGFTTITDTVRLTENSTRNYTMEHNTEQLEEVVLRAKMAMKVSKDTITYRPDSFVTGNERKLREMLEKLPGVEVDRDGNVTVQGKEVTDLLVDGKSFFGGDTKLGVNNIPADVVEEVEVIDDYHEVSFMKGLERSERMAMNIKLKEGKKEFLFGEIEAGGGAKERYTLHPSLFYYSPKTTMNFIGSLNNINKSPMSMSDVSRFRGGYSRLSNLINTLDMGLSQFASRRNIVHNKTKFTALNFTQKIGKKIDLEAYSILHHQVSEARTASQINYLTQDNLLEIREDLQNNKGLNTFNNIKFRYQPKGSTDIGYSLLINYSDIENIQNLSSQYNKDNNHTYSQQTPDNIEVSQIFRWSSQPTYKHTSEINANHSYKKQSNPADWLFDKPLFSNIIPSINEGEAYNFLQNRNSTKHAASAEFKHFWVLNNKNHVYPFVGMNFYEEEYLTHDYQVLQDGSSNEFSNSNFNNDIDFQLLNPYIGLQYKVMIGKAILRPGIVYHQYYWKIKQFEEKLVDRNKGIWLPELNVEYELNAVNKIILNYALNATFKDASEYANRYRLQGFNQLYRGNENLENERYHQTSLSYRIVKYLNNVHANLRMTYTKRDKNIRQSTILEGIDQIQTSIYSTIPENNYNFSGSFSKSWLGLTFASSVSTSFSDYSRIVNKEQIDIKNQNYGYALQLAYKEKNLPYIKVAWRQRFSNSQSETYKNKYVVTEPSIDLEYNFLKDFVLKTDFVFTYSKQKTTQQKENYQLGNASIEYRKNNSLWGFEFRVENIFDLKHRQIHSMNQFMIYDQWVYIHPRTVLFLISYKL